MGEVHSGREAATARTGGRPQFPTAAASEWDHLLMDQDDPEKRIAEVEGQLAEQNRGADLPPLGPDRAQPGSASNSDTAQRRFAVTAMPNIRKIYFTCGLLLVG